MDFLSAKQIRMTIKEAREYDFDKEVAYMNAMVDKQAKRGLLTDEDIKQKKENIITICTEKQKRYDGIKELAKELKL